MRQRPLLPQPSIPIFVFLDFLTPDAAAIVRESMQTSRGAVKVANKIIIHAEVLSEMFDREL